MLSFLYPIHNRADLFVKTLTALSDQGGCHRLGYEILVLDDGSTTDAEEAVARDWLLVGLPIRYIRLDVTRLPMPVYQHEGANNPACAWNVGALMAKGDRLVFTSPEIRFTKPTCLATLATTAQATTEALIADVYDATWKDTEFSGWIGGGPRQRALNFLAVYPRQAFLDVGGFDLDFMGGCGFEDTEFLERWQRVGHTFAFTGDAVTAEHQWHLRPEAERAEATERNRVLCEVRRSRPVAWGLHRESLQAVERFW